MIEDFKKYKITYSIIILNIVAYLFIALMSENFIDFNTKILVNFGALFSPLVVLYDEWWRLLTAMFLHGGLTHLGMNMFSLYLIGRSVESYFDAKSYIALYFFSGIMGGMASLYMHPLSVGVGASGAIFGIFGALAGFFLAYRDQIKSHTKAFMKDFSLILGINLVIGLSIESVDVSAHIGGLIVGAIGGFFLSKNRSYFTPFFLSMLFMIIAIAYFFPSEGAEKIFLRL